MRRAAWIGIGGGIGVGAVAAVLALARPTAPVAEGPRAKPSTGAVAAAPRPDAERLAELQALGYVDWAEVPPEEAGRRGVTRDVAGDAFPGLLFYHSRSRRRAHLLDPRGAPLHTWVDEEKAGGWHHVELAPGGELFVIRRDGVLARLGPDGTARWRRDLDVHHDLALDGAGGLWVLSHALVDVPFEGGLVPIVDDAILHLDGEGRVLARLSLHALLGDAVPRERLERIAARPARAWRDARRPLHGVVDVFHTNTVERLPRDVPGLGRRGDLLVGVRELDLVAVIDPRRERVVWRFGPGELDRPHQPTLRRNGRVLVFDNGPSRGWSRIVEVDPASRRVVWSWRAEPPATFYSEKMGGVEELPNGHVLVTESERGRAFELTPEGEIVWEFWNPEQRAGDRARASIHRMRKLDPRRVEAWLAGAGEPAG